MRAADVLDKPSPAFSEADIRNWLTLLRRPDRLAATDLAELLVERGLVAAHEREPRAPYQPEPIPAIGDYLPRSALITELQTLLAQKRLIVVAGPAGIGNTSLIAELAT
jgi:hypothetical protein